MIEITLETHRTGLERAECRVDGLLYVAESRHGAIYALCRKLREADVSDQPWEVPDRIGGGSIYWMADHTVSESTGRAQTVPFSNGPNSPSDLEAEKPAG